MHHRKLNMLSIQNYIQNITATQSAWSKSIKWKKNRKNSMLLTFCRMTKRMMKRSKRRKSKNSQKFRLKMLRERMKMGMVGNSVLQIILVYYQRKSERLSNRIILNYPPCFLWRKKKKRNIFRMLIINSKKHWKKFLKEQQKQKKY